MPLLVAYPSRMKWEAAAESAVRIRDLATDRSEWRFVCADDRPALCDVSTSTNGWRSVVLKARVSPGVCVLSEPALAFVTPSRVCAVCLQRSEVECETCGTRWCSLECKTLDKHACSALARLANLENEASADQETSCIDFETLRLAARIWVSDKLRHLEALCDHSDALVKAAREGDRAAEVALASAHMGATVAARCLGLQEKDEPKLAAVILKIRFNAFPFEQGLALFVRTSALNHSCAPNTTISIHAVKTALVCEARTHADLGKGTELTISYLALPALLIKRDRRKALRDAFFFDCQCVACLGSNEGRDAGRALDSATQDLLLATRTKDAERALDALSRANTVLSALRQHAAAVHTARARLQLLAARALHDAAVSRRSEILAAQARRVAQAALDSLLFSFGPDDLATRSAATVVRACRNFIS